jgi:hypothetical protein
MNNPPFSYQPPHFTTSGNLIKPQVPVHVTGGWPTLVPTYTSGNFIKLPTVPLK